MVMQNRHDGPNSPEWWEDLPPGIRKRFTNTLQPEPVRSADESPAARGNPSVDSRPGVLGDLSRVAGLFLAVAVANLLFLLLALAFLFGGQPTN